MSSHLPSVGCIVMASGMGRRFGSNKLLHEFQGLPLIEQILRTTDTPAFARRLVVTRHDEIAAYCEARRIPVLLHSLPLRSDAVRLGLAKLTDMDGCCFCAADQPLLRRESLEALCASFTEFPDLIHRLSFEETYGNPILFPRKFYPDLLNLPEGRGGSFLTQKYPEQVRPVPARDIYELFDIDTPEDFRRLSRL